MKKLLSFLLALLLVFSIISCTGTGDGPSLPDGNGTTEGSGGIGGGSSCAPHKDVDNNGSCDVCFESVIAIIDFYAINDLHGKLSDTEAQPGVDELTTYLENARKTDENVVVLSSGDMWQGTAESNLTRGKMMTEWLNDIGAVSMTLGNHEFDWACDYIYSNLEIAEFPFLAINIYNTATNTRVDFATPSTVVECGGAKVGIIGAIGDCRSSISQDKVMGIDFKVGRELAALVKAESEALREAGCDYIVFSVHDGVSRQGAGYITEDEMSNYYDLALSDGYIDLVFESHSHQDYVLRDSKGVYHIQGGGDNTAISHVEVKLNFANDSSEVTDIETVGADVYDDCAPDTIVSELREKYKAEIAKGAEKLGTIRRTIDGDELRQVSMDLYLEYGMERWGDKYDVALAGGYVNVRSPGVLFAGDVLYEDLYTLFPFDNGLYLCTISGRNLKRRFIETDNSNYFISMSDYGKSLTINDNSTYYIIADAYSVFYAPNGLTIVEEYGEELFARDMLAEYIKEGGLESGGISNGIKFTPIPEIISKITALGVNVETEESFSVVGTIIDEPQATYGNCTIMDADGNTIYLYGLYSMSGVRYDALKNKPQKGDTITVSGKALLYVNTANPGAPKPELKNCTVELVVKTSSISDALAAGEALDAGEVTAEQFCIYGKVSDTPQATYGNMTVVDAQGEEMYVYGTYDSEGQVRYDAMPVRPERGDTVIIYGYVKKYVRNGQDPIIEIERGHLLVLYKADGNILYYT